MMMDMLRQRDLDNCLSIALPRNCEPEVPLRLKEVYHEFNWNGSPIGSACSICILVCRRFVQLIGAFSKWKSFDCIVETNFTVLTYTCLVENNFVGLTFMRCHCRYLITECCSYNSYRHHLNDVCRVHLLMFWLSL